MIEPHKDQKKEGQIRLKQSTINKKIAPAKYVLSFNPSACRWCRCCELACSLYHGGTCSPTQSRMRLWVNTLELEAKASLCMQCATPRCMEACPVDGAMIVDPKTGARLIVESKCVGCGECAKICPFNAEGTIIFPNVKKDTYVKCDLCGGEPNCVEFCVTGALELKSLE